MIQRCQENMDQVYKAERPQVKLEDNWFGVEIMEIKIYIGMLSIIVFVFSEL